MDNIKALSLTILVGVFFLIGLGITKLTTKKKELTLIATGLSFIIMLSMILFDIIPEIAETLINVPNQKKWLMIIGFTALGMILLIGLDFLIPHHHHNHKENEKNHKEHNEHLFHIGFITSISLILHNLIEGLSIYATALTNFKMGLMMTLAVSLHNIPLGIEVAVGMESSKTKSKIKWLSMILLTISSFLGSLLLFISKIEIGENVLGALLCVTFGMLMYISLFELLREIWNNRKNKKIYLGMGLGVVIAIIMVIL